MAWSTRQDVFGYRNMLVSDGVAVPAIPVSILCLSDVA